MQRRGSNRLTVFDEICGSCGCLFEDHIGVTEKQCWKAMLKDLKLMGLLKN